MWFTCYCKKLLFLHNPGLAPVGGGGGIRGGEWGLVWEQNKAVLSLVSVSTTSIPQGEGSEDSNTALSFETVCILPSQLYNHCGLKISRSQAKIDENFANYFLKTKANNKCFIVLKCTYKGLQQSIGELKR